MAHSRTKEKIRNHHGFGPCRPLGASPASPSRPACGGARGPRRRWPPTGSVSAYGLGELPDVLGELPDGLGELPDGRGEVSEGRDKLPDGLGEAPEVPAALGELGELGDGLGEAPEVPAELGELSEGLGDGPWGFLAPARFRASSAPSCGLIWPQSSARSPASLPQRNARVPRK